MRQPVRTLAAVALVAVALTGCQRGTSLAAVNAASRVASAASAKKAFKAEIRQVTVQEGAALVGTPGLVFIDVREPDEFAGGHAKGAASRPLGQLAAWAPALDKSKPTLVICHSGRRSMIACQGLIERGFTDVINVQGGTAAWQAAGLPME